MPEAAELPAQMQPDPSRNPWLTMGWLRQAAADGRIAKPGHRTAQELADSTLRTSLRATFVPQPEGICAVAVAPVIRLLETGSWIDIGGRRRGGVAVGRRAAPILDHCATGEFVEPKYFQRLYALTGPLPLRLTAGSPDAITCEPGPMG